MSVPPEVMQRMMASRGAGGAGGPSSSPPGAGGGVGEVAQGAQAPSGSPTSQPQDKRGLKASALANVTIMQNLAEQALQAFQPSDPEYKALLKCLTVLEPLAAKHDASDLVPASVMQMVGQLPQMGGGSDVQRMIMQQMQKPQGGQHPQGGGMPPQQPQPGAM